VGKNGAVQAVTDGLLGLGRGSVNLLSQLKQQGVTKNVLGHCLSTKGGGFLFFGDDIVPTSRVTWVPMARSTSGYTSLSPMFLICDMAHKALSIFCFCKFVNTLLQFGLKVNILLQNQHKYYPFCAIGLES